MLTVTLVSTPGDPRQTSRARSVWGSPLSSVPTALTFLVSLDSQPCLLNSGVHWDLPGSLLLLPILETLSKQTESVSCSHLSGINSFIADV